MDKKEKKKNLAISLAEELNKSFKKTVGRVAYFIGGENTPTDISEWVSIGSTMLDLAISNRPHGGIPVGRITEITGLESSGKSLLATHVLAETQKKDGVAVYIDTENALSEDFLKAIGIDLSKMVYTQLDTVEQIFESIEKIINKVREENKDKLVTIVVDSLAAASTNAEMSGDYDKDGWATGKAIIISKALRKITRLIGKERIAVVFTNQLRVKLGVMFGDPYTTSGGKALPYHASVRIRVASAGQLKQKTEAGEEIVGIKVKSQVRKNRVGPPLRKAEFNVFFNRGIDDYGEWLQIMKDSGNVKRSNPGSKIVDQHGESISFLTEDWGKLLDGDEEFKKFIYDKICDIKIMKYCNEDEEEKGIDYEGIELDDEVIDENE